jgi:alkanesulfonate monooxygenase SsuD/methylene tetrahydromethanopterin reductase-like flavin-dependent oxidoreductase (luciferase family)
VPRSDAAAPAPPSAIAKPPLRLGFFTRLLDQADAAERYRLATAQIIHAERCGFDSAWVAHHHFHEDEGGLPAPFVFLSQVAARTTRSRLGTGIVTLPLELPVRVAEDAAVLDLMCGGRLEVRTSFTPPTARPRPSTMPGGWRGDRGRAASRPTIQAWIWSSSAMERSRRFRCSSIPYSRRE